MAFGRSLHELTIGYLDLDHEEHKLACSCHINCIACTGTFILIHFSKNLVGKGGGGTDPLIPLDPPLPITLARSQFVISLLSS